ncbi:MAG: RDD family protein [Acidobacteria bacterium]|jgi:uncharacterized RDD family membrane protein YckC|nr:RDD family protein [Acidobacteriota bacterium]
MSARIERTTARTKAPAKNFRAVRRVVSFDVERLKAPFLLRCGAILIDYILLAAVPVTGLLLGRFFNYDGAKLLNNEVGNAAWLITLLLFATNFFIFPLLSGQSVGKMLTGLKIVRKDGGEATLPALLIRHLIGYPLVILTAGFGFLISVFNSKGRALHDFLAGTVVVYGERREKQIKN